MNKKELICYGSDASGLTGIAEKIVFPRNTEQVLAIMKSPAADIVPRGAGSGLVGGAVPNNSLVVDMSKMNRILKFNPVKRMIKVEAGITLRELNEKLKSKGFEFPIDVSNKGISTIGGMIATNASGDRSMKYGTIKDWIDEIEFVNGEGELIKAKKTDLGDVCGMEGITGIIVSAVLKLIPLIRRSSSIFQTDDLDELLSVARRAKSEKEVVKLKFFSKYVSKLLGLAEKYNLVIEFDSERGKIHGEEYEKLLKLEENVYNKLALEGYSDREDPKFFFDKIKEFVYLLELMNIPYFGHLGAGIIHPFFKKEEKEKREKINELIRKSQGKLGKYGIGLIRKNFLDSFEITLIQRVKSRHDPYGRMNRGKVIDGGNVKIRRKIDMPESVKAKDRIIDVKPGLGERKSAAEVLIEMESEEKKDGENICKSPEEKLQEFIQEVSKEEKVEEKEVLIEEVKLEYIKPEEIKPCEINLKEREIMERIRDYEQTFESELFGERKKAVEDTVQKSSDFSPVSPNSQKEFSDYAKQVPREIVRTDIMQERPRPKPNVDYKLINDIMNNKHTPGKINNIPINKESANIGPVKSEKKEDSDERDIINKIITNRFSQRFVSRDNKNDKKEEKK
ncbi:MAG: FAD-binding oxidoreductase [Nanoarchaeota archaeon]